MREYIRWKEIRNEILTPHNNLRETRDFLEI